MGRTNGGWEQQHNGKPHIYSIKCLAFQSSMTLVAHREHLQNFKLCTVKQPFILLRSIKVVQKVVVISTIKIHYSQMTVE